MDGEERIQGDPKVEGLACTMEGLRRRIALVWKPSCVATDESGLWGRCWRARGKRGGGERRGL